MNSLNLLSGRVSPPHTPAPSRSNSFGNILSSIPNIEAGESGGVDVQDEKQGEAHLEGREDEKYERSSISGGSLSLDEQNPKTREEATSVWFALPKRIASALIETIRWLLSTVASPGIYLFSILYSENGALRFSPTRQKPKLSLTSEPAESVSNEENSPIENNNNRSEVAKRTASKEAQILISPSYSSGMSSGSESERDRPSGSSSSARGARSKISHHTDEISPARRSIRIKLHNEDNLRQRTNKRPQILGTQKNESGAASSEITPANLKSPTSPAAALLMTKYPRTPAPPRPIIPRRQPSYSIPEAPNGRVPQKTLILDLDETLIHSMAKGGRMSTGHMVEVKLNTVVGAGSAAIAGPQHPILYFVHKRPYCDEFLRKVCKWYNLVIFTASVQEYADPVIDWLEQERKFFSGRYYRQHCTYRHGAFIKDLSSVEPDLSKVMILDNSPLSYMFHQDNAIPIEGWISDPTDNDLLHLVPLLEGLQYVTDVRAFLALRGGEDGKHIA